MIALRDYLMSIWHHLYSENRIGVGMAQIDFTSRLFHVDKASCYSDNRIGVGMAQIDFTSRLFDVDMASFV